MVCMNTDGHPLPDMSTNTGANYIVSMNTDGHDITQFRRQESRKRKYTASEANEEQTIDIREINYSDWHSVKNLLEKWIHHGYDIKPAVLHQAIQNASLETTSGLLRDFKTDPNTELPENRDSPIIAVVRASNRALLQKNDVKLGVLEDILHILVEYGGNVNTRDSEDKSPIEIAAENGNVRMIELLGYRYKANLEMGFFEKLTPRRVWRSLWRHEPQRSALIMAQKNNHQLAMNLLVWIAHERTSSACHQDSFVPEDSENECPICKRTFGVETNGDGHNLITNEPWVCVPCGHRCCGHCLKKLKSTHVNAVVCMSCRMRPITWIPQSQCPAQMKLYARFCVQLPLTP